MTRPHLHHNSAALRPQFDLYASVLAERYIYLM
jgi:hypothetical protein